jgi:hypothetical protein
MRRRHGGQPAGEICEEERKLVLCMIWKLGEQTGSGRGGRDEKESTTEAGGRRGRPLGTRLSFFPIAKKCLGAGLLDRVVDFLSVPLSFFFPKCYSLRLEI